MNNTPYTQCVPEFPAKRKPGIVGAWLMAALGFFALVFALTSGLWIMGGIGLFFLWISVSGNKVYTFRTCPVCHCEIMEKHYNRTCSTCGAEVGKPFVPK
jgi:hypothetical protein